jgi:uncharacterized protein YukE
MSSDYMSVETSALDSHGRNLGSQASAVQAAYENFRNSLAALGTPWGEGDHYAEAFAEWYEPASKQLLESLQSVAGKVNQAHKSVVQASDNYKANAAASE